MSDVLVLDRHYDTSPQRVFAAWSEIDLVRKWFGCGPGQLWDIHRWDCRAGGELHVSLTLKDRVVEVRGEFLQVTPPHRIVYRWGEERVEVDIADDGGRTRVRLTHHNLADAADRTVREGGWTHCLDNLVKMLAVR